MLSDSIITRPFRRIVAGIVLFILICVVAVIGYVLAGWRPDDAIYMVIITIFGVGYGEVQPVQSPGLRLLTIAVIIAGYGAVIYTVGGFMQMLIDGELKRALGARRMNLEIDRLDKHTILCGIGRLGSILARELADNKKPFVAIDSDPQRLHEAEERGYLVIHGDATEEEVLERAGIGRAATIATVLSDDATNVFVTITARELNPKAAIIARAENPRTEKKLLGSGASQVVLPTAIGAQRVAQLIIRPTAENLLQQIQEQSSLIGDLGNIGLEFHELRVQAHSPLANRAISDIEIRSNHGFLIVGIRRAHGATTLNPEPATRLEVDDIVVVLGHKNDMPALERRFSNPQRMTYRGLTIEN